jgi:hypothetical protein
MTNSRLHALIALGAVLIVVAFAASLPSVLPASERIQALRICREEGISQASELHEICLAQTIRALEREDYWLARSFARVGLQPETDGFRTCLDRESYARSLMVPRGDRR